MDSMTLGFTDMVRAATVDGTVAGMIRGMRAMADGMTRGITIGMAAGMAAGMTRGTMATAAGTVRIISAGMAVTGGLTTEGAM